jgi:hypothetical protein
MKKKIFINKSYSQFMFLILFLFLSGSITPKDEIENGVNQSIQRENLNKLSQKEINDGWKLLFDGKSTKQWKNTKGNELSKNGWMVKDGILTVLGSSPDNHVSGSDIITTEQFGDFELTIEYKLTKGANSGIKYFVVNDFAGQRGYLGLEYQLIDDENHEDAQLGKNGNRTNGSLYDLIPSKEIKNKLIGTWNQAKILVKGNDVEHWLNGVKILEFDRRSVEFQTLVSRSKYKNLKGFGEHKAGHILLQGHGDTVHFRNIKIKN